METRRKEALQLLLHYIYRLQFPKKSCHNNKNHHLLLMDHHNVVQNIPKNYSFAVNEIKKKDHLITMFCFALALRFHSFHPEEFGLEDHGTFTLQILLDFFPTTTKRKKSCHFAFSVAIAAYMLMGGR